MKIFWFKILKKTLCSVFVQGAGFQWAWSSEDDYQSVVALLARDKIAINDDIIKGGGAGWGPHYFVIINWVTNNLSQVMSWREMRMMIKRWWRMISVRLWRDCGLLYSPPSQSDRLRTFRMFWIIQMIPTHHLGSDHRYQKGDLKTSESDLETYSRNLNKIEYLYIV